MYMANLHKAVHVLQSHCVCPKPQLCARIAFPAACGIHTSHQHLPCQKQYAHQWVEPTVPVLLHMLCCAVVGVVGVLTGITQTGGLDLAMNLLLGKASTVFWAQVRGMCAPGSAIGLVAPDCQGPCHASAYSTVGASSFLTPVWQPDEQWPSGFASWFAPSLGTRGALCATHGLSQGHPGSDPTPPAFSLQTGLPQFASAQLYAPDP